MDLNGPAPGRCADQLAAMPIDEVAAVSSAIRAAFVAF
jgi:hypothetical protein